jgi:putative membrane protein
MIEYAELPKLNAVLNSVAAVLLVCGYLAIRARRIALHRAIMIAAVTTSAAFLVSYLIYHYNSLHTVFAGPTWVRAPYYAMLTSHIVLAVALVPLVLVTLYRAARGDFARHLRIARWTLPIWLYVSVTGVLVYLALYVVFPGGEG